MPKKKSLSFFFFFLFFSLVLSFDSNDLNVFANSSDYNNFDVNNVVDSNFVFDENIFGVNFDLNVVDSNFFVVDFNVGDFNNVFDLNVVDSNFFDGNVFVDLNSFANSDYNDFDSNSFVMDFNVGDFNNGFDLNAVDVNFSDSNYLSEASNIDSNIGSFSLNFFSDFLSNIASLFSKFSDFIGLNKFFGGFAEVVFPQDKNFELKEKEVEINGQKAKCFGVACDSLPVEVQ